MLLGADLRPARPEAPLSRWLSVHTDRPTRLQVGWSDVHGPRQVAFDTLQTEHEVLLVGFHPAASYPLQLELTDAQGRRTTAAGPVVTLDPLPTSFPELTLLSSEPSRIQPGLSLVTMRPAKGSPYQELNHLVILDSDAHVVWSYAAPRFVYDVRMQPDGTLLAAEDGTLIELDLAGERRSAWQPEGWGVEDALELEGFPHELHHEVFPMADGGLLTLSLTERLLADYPTSTESPVPTAPARIADDLVLAIDRDGTVRWSWSLADLLDPHRIGYDSLRTRSSDIVPGPLDWAHANAVVEHPDGGIVVSLRHQDAVIKFDPMSGQLSWILANHDNWPERLRPYLLEPVGTLAWPYHQHAPMVGHDGQIVMFDNGNHRASPWTDQQPLDESDSYSRAVAYRVDEAARTVEQTLSYVDNPNTGPIFAGQIGDADWLDNGNVLITYGHATHTGGQTTASQGLSAQTIRIVEIDPQTGDTVWDLQIATPPALDPAGWTGNRTQRIEGLYPHLWASR